MDFDAALLLDLKGLKCPLPVLRVRKALAKRETGSVIMVETTDPLAVIDIPHFCHEDGHQLVKSEGIEGGHRFFIRKAERSKL